MLLGTLGLLKPLVLSLGSIKTLTVTNVLGTSLAYDLFGQTVPYASHCQGLRCIWIFEDGRRASALSSNDPEEVAHQHELEPASFSVCSLTHLQLGRMTTFVTSKINQVEIAWSKFQESISENYVSFELSNRNDIVAKFHAQP